MSARQSAIVALSLATISFSLACSHFKGPGDYRSGVGDFRNAEEMSEEYQQLPPAGGVTWRAARRTDPAYSEVNFDWPVDQARLTQGFQVGKKVHWGVDLAGPKGTPILA